MEARDLAVGLAGGRIAIGVVSLLAPGVVGRAMMGPDADSGGTRLLLRVVGARDLTLGIGVLAALERNAPVQAWLRASVVADGLDLAGSVLARRHLRPIVFTAAAGAATAGALLSGWLAGQLDA
jgi:peptide-methionine (R)-S-oxide reductase